ncbi:NADH-quinone oxidoreductase subunit 9 [Oxobacter pfennigii]|uniref:NADH-quinone oxidoreductase subunit 9 n=1 Tax=Oxobacter pfennigii TaxID=36849 RepID=A0A0P8WEE3_9CLOT|nr:NADH-quinone oxidoreductase subunit I [Oxobacter pfennigii]KPU46098.1 NADH-quinone oxidoreductase subunit 9 [Oxobacter pfennigii]
MYGLGIVKGMGITMKRFFKKKVTVQYPDVKPVLPERSHGSLGFDFDKCIACNMCADACPNGVIKVDFTKDEKGKRVLKDYNMNLGYCLFCGLCVKACPKDAVYFKKDFHMVCYQKCDTAYHWDRHEITNSAEDLPVDNIRDIEGKPISQGV